jgi:hypothetical protein
MKSRRIRWAGYVARIGEKRNMILVRNPEGKRSLGRPRRKLVVNNKMYLRELGYGGMEWIDLSKDREQLRAVANEVMNLRVP